MIFQLLFDAIGFIMLGGSLYFGVKMLLLATSIRTKNLKFIGKEWNGRASSRQMKKLLFVTDENSIKDIQQFLYYSNIVKVLIVGGFIALLSVAAVNSFVNK